MLSALRQLRHVARLIVEGSKALLLSLTSMSSCAIALRHVMSAQSFLRRSSLLLRSPSTSAQMSSPNHWKSSAIELGCALCRSSVVLFVGFP